MRHSYLVRFVALFMFCCVEAVGCGSDDSASASNSDTRTPAAGSGSTVRMNDSASKVRGDVTKDDCLVQTLGVFAVRPDGYSTACVDCLCTQSPRAVALCDDQSNNCWGLIGCMAAKCADAEGIDEANCAVAMCGEFIEGSGAAMSVGVLLRGDACSAKCPLPSK